MAEKRKPRKKTKRTARKKVKLNWPLIFGVSLLLSACCFITLSPYLRLPFAIPTWQEIFAAVQLDDSVSPNSPDEPLRVHYIDVGQGDSILIQYKKHNILIDAGENGCGSGILKYLKKQGVSSLDYAIATHPHSDHIGGMDEVIKELSVKEVFLPRLPEELQPTTKSYTSLLYAVSESGARLTAPEDGQKIEWDDFVLTFMVPKADYDNLNNMSVIAKVNYKNASYLFNGDAEKEREKELLSSGADLKADVLKAGHHGSSTSSTADFIHAVKPKIAVISCGKDNDYGHPSKKTLKTLSDAKVYRTDRSGTIVISSNGEKYTVSEEKTA